MYYLSTVDDMVTSGLTDKLYELYTYLLYANINQEIIELFNILMLRDT